MHTPLRTVKPGLQVQLYSCVWSTLQTPWFWQGEDTHGLHLAWTDASTGPDNTQGDYNRHGAQRAVKMRRERFFRVEASLGLMGQSGVTSVFTSTAGQPTAGHYVGRNTINEEKASWIQISRCHKDVLLSNSDWRKERLRFTFFIQMQ